MSDRVTCSVCDAAETVVAVTRARLPAMQNYVYRDRESALAAKTGRFELRVCATCGYAWNAAFDPALLDYDEGYDNSVPSARMGEYYATIARYLHDGYALERGLVIDVGCGKGTFLGVLRECYPATRGLGIDPSYEGPLDPAPGLQFVREFFDASQVTERPSLVVCRHVAEHIARPVSFFASIREALRPHAGVPLFFEVPDARWILETGSFWDFCYEHVNYFTAASLRRALALAGLRPTRDRTGFGDQYLWAEAATPADGEVPNAGDVGGGLDVADAFADYAAHEARRLSAMRETVERARGEGHAVAVWGMATKGVVFANLIDPERALIDRCVDANRNKHGCYVPLTGHRIDAPESLCDVQRAGDGRLLVVVMNPNYLGEIVAQCDAMGLRASFMDATGAEI